MIERNYSETYSIFKEENRNMATFKDDKITIIENDLEKIMNRPTMYISSIGPTGILHLCKEIINNNTDECYKKASPGNSIYIEITDKCIMSKDNGRGIPTDKIRKVHETLQAGSNMTISGGYTAGENGAGTSTYTALARRLELESLRPSEKKKITLVYENGKCKSEKIEPYNGKDHGMRTKFWPSKKILGDDQIPVDMVVDWINRNFRYTLPSDINIVYSINGGKDIKLPHLPISVFFDEYIKGDQRMSSVLSLKCSGKLKEDYMGEVYDRHFELEAAIVYSDPHFKGDPIKNSWMNMIFTKDNGDHINAVEKAFVNFISEAVIKKNKRLADEDLKRDILTNFHICVNARSDFANMFSAQAKDRVLSSPLRQAMTIAMTKALQNLSQSDIDEYVNICIANNRVRREGEKARDITKLTKDKNKWEKPDSFYPCSNENTPEGKELFLVEGLSAGGGLRTMRNARYQAILAFRGKSLNIWDVEIADVLRSAPWLNLVNILGCGIGSNFNIKKLKYDKIIIATDADIDGYHIRTLFLIFFFRFMPEIVKEGKLYVAEPPLYQLTKGKQIVYVANQKEYIDECITAVSDIEIEFPLVG